MTKEYKFRGKSKEHGWVYGDLLQYPNGEVYIMEHSDGQDLSYPVDPDTVAVIFTLTNGDPTRWRNRQTTEVTGKDGKDLFKTLSDEELDKQITDLEKKLKQ